MATFLELVRAGEVNLDAIDDFVERWHAGEGDGRSLAAWLGLTDADYARWVRDPDALKAIVAADQKRPAAA